MTIAMTVRRAVACTLAFVALGAAFGQTRVRIPRARAEYDIGVDFDKVETWRQKGVDFVESHKVNHFRFLEASRKDSANAIREGNVKFHGLEVYETRMWFTDECVSRIELSLYNKGDAREPLSQSALLDILKTVRRKLTEEGAKPPQPDTESRGGVMQKTITWKKREPAAARLTWRYKRVSDGVDVDFVRLTLVNSSGGAAAVGDALAARKETRRGAVRKNVVKVAADGAGGLANARGGDVYIAGVPMVDQGQKGYCAVATSERVLRYYGQNVDEHELGASAGSSADGGTSSEAMYETVRAIGRRHGLSTYVVCGDLGRSAGDRIEALVKEVEDYNKFAKRMRRPEIAKSVYMRGHVFDAPAARGAMEADVRRAMRLKGSRFRAFQKTLRTQINAGVPILWAVTLGIFPEPDIPQARGGHMRLIIGYNDKTREIVYTDTWGAGHEYKRMSVENAWTITDAALYLKPTRE
jgi:hypothetical protein